MNPVRKNTNRDEDMNCPVKHNAELSNGVKKKTLEKNPVLSEPGQPVVVDVPKGKLAFIKDRCKGCGFCIEFCPKKVLEFSSETNAKGYRIPQPVRADQCILCGFCSMYCPDFAIYQVKDAKDSRHEPARLEDVSRSGGDTKTQRIKKGDS